MEIILRSDNKSSIARMIALAKKLNVPVEQRSVPATDQHQKADFKEWLLNFKAMGRSSFGDAAEWERNEREDRELPFPS